MIVAKAQSSGGKCAHCRGRIFPGQAIFKVPLDGHATRQGQGPGFWVGSCCRDEFDETPWTLFEKGNDDRDQSLG